MTDDDQAIESMTAPTSTPFAPGSTPEPCVVLSFDVEEHYRIEAASHLTFSPEVKAQYAARVGPVTRWILEQLGERDIKATFFIVGELAINDPGLIREIHSAGHEVASHGWDHRRILAMTPDDFREDLRRSVDILQQITGEAVYGYRAPTFSLVRKTAWAIDILADSGLIYDSSIFPIRHDRYGIPNAPRHPYWAVGPDGGRIVEFPPATLQLGNIVLPVGGGGYFRLFPDFIIQSGIRQCLGENEKPVVMLYFHPWEFEADQPHLPLSRVGKFRTYVGIKSCRRRVLALVRQYRFRRAVDLLSKFDIAS